MKKGKTKYILSKITKFSAIVWILSIIVFFLNLLPYSSSDQVEKPFSIFANIVGYTTLFVGIISFLVFAFSMFIKFIKPKILPDIIFLKINKKTIIIVSLIVFLFTLFYWFQIRPSQIKSACFSEIKEKLWDEKTMTQLDFHYKWCLHRNGL